MTSSPTENTAWLIPLAGGPPLKPMPLVSAGREGRGLLIGREEACNLRLDDPRVSRQHAQLAMDSGEWRIADKGSRWGTFVNEQKLQPGTWVPLVEGDHIQITPWIFRFSARGIPHSRVRSTDDAGHTTIRTVAASKPQPLKEELLNVLLEGSSMIQAARDEATLFQSLLEIASRGTGLPNAAVLRALDSDGHVEIITERSGRLDSDGTRFSRSLLAAAAQGEVAELSAASDGDISHSMIDLNMQAAICAPLMLGATVAAYLYLDSRGSPAGGLRTLRPNAAGFCHALARMGGGALANLKRSETELRMVRLQADLEAAGIAQRMILPRGAVSSGDVHCYGMNCPSKHLSGDFFDAFALPDGRLVVTLGDVSGHGAQASVLMSTVQGFLRAALQYHDDLARAVTDLNSYLQTHCPPDKFITLWIGLFDGPRKQLSYVDAGHGLAMLLNPDGGFKTLDANDGHVLHALPDFQYHAASEPLTPGGRLLIVSDGIKEQTPAMARENESRSEFGIDRVKAVAAAEGNEMVERLFAALYEFSGTKELSDDATAVLVRWS
jgi:serine phosphatase RsbU (regulator of sigma subunit)